MTWLRKENWSIKKGEPWVNCHVRKLWYPSKTISPGPVLQSDIKILSIKAWRNENKTRRGVSRKVLSWHENLLKTTQNENNNKGARQNCSTVRKLNKQDHPSRDIVKIKLYSQKLFYQQHLAPRWSIARESSLRRFLCWTLSGFVRQCQTVLTLRLLRVLRRAEFRLQFSQTIYISTKTWWLISSSFSIISLLEKIS